MYSLPSASRALFRQNFEIQDPAFLFATPLPRLPRNSNFLHLRSQFHSRLLSLSLLSDLSLSVAARTALLLSGAAT
jgi:hypothetical protein